MSEPAQPKDSSPSFLTVDEAAELLRVNRKTLYEAIRLGQVPGVVRLGRCVRLSRATMLSWSPGQGGPALKEKQS
ncbi:helix-turn-helix domain-containing protein [Corallococcus exiguus]|uniref:helix-turn-helix domain-containing protein n=1 Tax=Corallococcus exiguus TaxID=83462 RepID=UPI0015604387|nr:helix-turn-helix domain-containing protein [Corallococcus exiguus]NRD59209.1 helix-turn-helix domain-containing protein [Corallococcus exiguus]NRD65470.1 helix-turn-helix domain-containing protein [Corallococcus exiguus]